MNQLGKWVVDKQLLGLIGKYLRSDVSIKGELESTLCGILQGGSLSPVLTNIMLDSLDRYLEGKGYLFARYADDFVVRVQPLTEG